MSLAVATELRDLFRSSQEAANIPNRSSSKRTSASCRSIGRMQPSSDFVVIATRGKGRGSHVLAPTRALVCSVFKSHYVRSASGGTTSTVLLADCSVVGSGNFLAPHSSNTTLLANIVATIRHGANRLPAVSIGTNAAGMLA